MRPCSNVVLLFIALRFNKEHSHILLDVTGQGQSGSVKMVVVGTGYLALGGQTLCFEARAQTKSSTIDRAVIRGIAKVSLLLVFSHEKLFCSNMYFSRILLCNFSATIANPLNEFWLFGLGSMMDCSEVCNACG